MDGVKDCPMCGGQPDLVETTVLSPGGTHANSGTIGAVHCPNCHYAATNANTQLAIDLWNKIDGPPSDSRTPRRGQ